MGLGVRLSHRPQKEGQPDATGLGSRPQPLLVSLITTSRAALRPGSGAWTVAVGLSEDGVSVRLRVMA